jgi:ketosteroid isomerase-like protein
MEMVAAKKKDAWLALYTDDTVIEDPVGPSPFDPEGKGHRGKERIAAFWDATIAATERLDFEITKSYATECEVANVGVIIATLSGGQQMHTDGVYVYRVAPDGRIESLRAYWEFERAMGTFSSGER